MPPDYLITVSASKDKEAHAPVERLVSAKNEAAAIRHVVGDTLTCGRATIADALRLGKLGVEVEKAA